MTFTQVIFEALAKQGIDLDETDEHAYLHSWNVVGHLLGIRADLLPIDRDSAAELTAAIRRRQYAPSAAGREMAAALLHLAESETHPRALAHLPRALLRYFVGDHIADILAIPPSGVTGAAFAPLRRLMSAVALANQHDRLLRVAVEHLNRELIEGWLVFERGGSRPTFSLPDHLADKWKVPVRPDR
jgi:hypothetical protein